MVHDPWIVFHNITVYLNLSPYKPLFRIKLESIHFHKEDAYNITILYMILDLFGSYPWWYDYKITTELMVVFSVA